MARRKKVQRPTLEEIKLQEGRFTVALLGFPEKEGEPFTGVLTFEESPVQGQPMAVIPVHLEIPLFEPTVIKNSEYWLNDYGFQRAYNTYTGLQIFRSNEVPAPVDKSFPPNLADLNDRNRETIYRMCMTPYWGRGKEEIDALINMDRLSSPVGDRVTRETVRIFRMRVLLPFLTGWKIMEERFQNRRVIVDKIQVRIDLIEREAKESPSQWLLSPAR